MREGAEEERDSLLIETQKEMPKTDKRAGLSDIQIIRRLGWKTLFRTAFECSSNWTQSLQAFEDL